MTVSVSVSLTDKETGEILREDIYEFLNPRTGLEVYEGCDGYVYSHHQSRGHLPIDEEWEEICKEYESKKEEN